MPCRLTAGRPGMRIHPIVLRAELAQPGSDPCVVLVMSTGCLFNARRRGFMKRCGLSLRCLIRLSAVAVLVLVVAESASAQQLARIAKYTLADPAKKAQLFQVTDEINELYRNSFAFQSLKLFYDPATHECVAVSLWESRSGLQATIEADAFKGLLDKVKPLTKGDFTVKTYEVYQPKTKR